jgi:hypothetical protein
VWRDQPLEDHRVSKGREHQGAMKHHKGIAIISPGLAQQRYPGKAIGLFYSERVESAIKSQGFNPCRGSLIFFHNPG